MSMRVRRLSSQSSDLRLWALMGVMALALLFLIGSLWRLQVARVSLFEAKLDIQSLRRVRLPGVRGKIYDRNGLCLADNRPMYSIAIFPEEMRRPGAWSNTVNKTMAVMEEVAEIIGKEPVLERKNIAAHIKRRLPLPLLAWKDIDERTMARLAEQGTELDGVDIYTQATRIYPGESYTSHLLGYVGRADPDLTEDIRYNYYLPEMAGRAGLEKHFDPFLRGRAGGTIVQIDVRGYRHGEMFRRAPEPGGDIRLTLDMEVQLLAHQALSTNRGAVVVLDPNNGDVLAMVSSPAFDANRIRETAYFKQINSDPGRPQLNRATAGEYPPGSTFKPVVALAAVNAKPETARIVHECPARFQLGRRTFRDWNSAGHGRLSMRQALKRSANVYFFKTALDIGWEPICEQAAALGLGEKTGIEIYERPGLLPGDTWKRKKGYGGWADGDTCNLAIGQGYLLVTPLQMAVLTAAIANGGYLYRPRLVEAYRPPGTGIFESNIVGRKGRIPWSDESLCIVQSGMRDVIMEANGTGRRARVEGFTFAGKTGTAEYGLKGEGKKHTWMLAYAPFDDPQYAIAFLIEDGDSGGSTVAPRLQELMRGLYEKMKREGGAS